MKKNKKIVWMVLPFLIIVCIKSLSAFDSKAQNSKIGISDSYIDLVKINTRFEEGMLDIPEKFQQELLLYMWVSEALDQYLKDSGDKTMFYCDLDRNLLYGSRRPDMSEEDRENCKYSYLLCDNNQDYVMQDSYGLVLGDEENPFYVEVDVQNNEISIYPECQRLGMNYYMGNPKAYEQIVRDEDNHIIYYPDFYVEADWNDMETIDNYFAGVDAEDLENLDYLKVPEGAGDSLYIAEYLSVAAILQRYMEENQIEDVFYFDAEDDIVSKVTVPICTFRVRGSKKALYIDIDFFYMKCHVYEVEK